MAGSKSHAEERNDLTKRSIPHMTLAQDNNNNNNNNNSNKTHITDSLHPAAGIFSIAGNAIITGGTGAIGLVVARAMLQHGLSGLAIFDLNVAASGAAVQALRDEFPRVASRIEAREVDVTDEEAIAAAVAETAVVLGSVDMLVCFAGIVGCTHALDMPASGGGGGRIVLTASISAHRVNFPQPQAAYNVSKAAVVALKSSLAAEWARYGITVNSISPGYMDTVLNEGEGLATARKTWCERNPLGRMGVPEEVAGVVVTLLSRAGSYMNGADIIVDGGGVVFEEGNRNDTEHSDFASPAGSVSGAETRDEPCPVGQHVVHSFFNV